MKTVLFILLFIQFVSRSDFPQVLKNTWYQQGPYGGIIQDIAVSDENKVAVISSNEVSVLNYEWVDVTEGNSVTSIDYFPNTSVLIAIKNNSIFKTSDNGYHWFNVFSTEDSLIDLSPVKINSHILLSWSNDKIYVIDYFTSDYDSIEFSSNILSVIPHPGFDSTFYVISDSGLYFTNNFGTYFSHITNIPGKITSLKFSSDYPYTIFASNSNNDTIFKSSDNGLKWEINKLDKNIDTQINEIAIHPTLNSLIFAATDIGIYVSTNAGNDWNPYLDTLQFRYFGILKNLGVQKIFLTANEIYAGTKEGLFVSHISNDDWKIIGPLNQKVNCLGKSIKFFNERIFAGTSNGIKIFDYDDWSVSSLYSSEQLSITSILTNDYQQNKIVLAASINTKGQPVIYQSYDNGDSWKEVFRGDSGTGKINQFYQKMDSTNIIYALSENKGGDKGLFKSSSFGDSSSWSVVTLLNKSFNYMVSNPITNEIYLLLDKKELYKLNTNDSLEFQSAIPGNHFNSLYFDKNGVFLYAAGDGVKKTLDFKNWESFGLDTFEVVEVVEDYSSIFAATKNNGVYISYYTAGDWYPFDYGLPKDIEITDIINFSHGVLHIGTRNNSVFMMYAIINNAEDEKENHLQFSLSQNYPNPFNPKTRIKYTVPNETTNKISHVQLNIYNAIGERVAELIDQVQLAGNYEIEFDGTNLASGVYFYLLNIGEYKLARKMILVK